LRAEVYFKDALPAIRFHNSNGMHGINLHPVGLFICPSESDVFFSVRGKNALDRP